MKFKPKISVIIINYNRKAEILKLCDLLGKQTYKKIEIIVVDNCSQDGSASKIQKKHPQVKVIKLAKNLGVGGLNIGMQEASGDIFVMLDNDVEVGRKLCQEVWQYFQKNPQADGLVFRMINDNSGHYRSSPHKLPKQKNHSGPETTIISQGIGAIRREVFEKIGGFNEAYFIYGNEFEYGARALEAGFNLRYSPKIVVRHKEALSNIRESGKASFFVARNWVYFLYEFIPLKDLIDFMPFSSKIFIKSGAKSPRKIRYYIWGVIAGLLTFWKIIPKRKKLSPEVLKKVKGGILGTNGFIYPW